MDTPATSPRTIAAWSFSRLEIFEKCRYHAYLQFVEKRPTPDAVADSKGEIAAARGTAIHTAAEKFVMGEGVIVEELQKPIIAERLNYWKERYAAGTGIVEEEWGFTNDWTPTGYYAKDVWLRVKCDVVGYDSGLVEVEDYKSGKRYGNEVKHAQQGLLYGISSMLKYPDATKAAIRFTYVDENKSIQKVHDRATLMRMLPMWHQRAMKMTTATEFPPNPNKINCRFCPYSPNNGGDGSCKSGVEV